MTDDARTGIQWLDHDECLRLLAADEIGRLAVLDGHTPITLPVNYLLDGEAVVVRTDPGTKLDHRPGAPASFEIDHFDREDRTGWSVLVVGTLDEVAPYDPQMMERVDLLPVDPWAEGEKAHWLRLMPTRITGRRIGRLDGPRAEAMEGIVRG